MRRAALALVTIGASVAFACGDPVHSNEVDALGPAPNGGRPGPEHRPGQPCIVCHGGSGPASAQFSMGGTIYLIKGQTDPAPNVVVKITDSRGQTHSVTTNKVGNFYIPVAEWDPTPPHSVELHFGDTYVNPMGTKIGRDGSCANCHFGKPGPSTPGPVYLATDPADLPGAM